MNQQTRVKAIRVKTKALRLVHQASSLTEVCSQESTWKQRFMCIDRLVRNMAVVGCLVLVVTAVRNSSLPVSKSVFEAVQASAGMQWDESLGKLSFVNAVLPVEIQEVWQETKSMVVSMPVDGKVVHAWSETEPFLLIEGERPDVYSVMAGEVMSVSHGMNEEKIVRIRHEDGSEAIYGNMEKCSVEAGDHIFAGTQIGVLIPGQALAFELRMNGKTAQPVLGTFTFE